MQRRLSSAMRPAYSSLLPPCSLLARLCRYAGCQPDRAAARGRHHFLPSAGVTDIHYTTAPTHTIPAEDSIRVYSHSLPQTPSSH